MCLIFLAINQHPDWPLIIAGNRDEFHARPTRALQAWPEAPEYYGGKDLQAGGSWLMARAPGRWSALTNIRNPKAAPAPGSRGQRVLDALADTPLSDEPPVGGYNLLYGQIEATGRTTAHYRSNGGGLFAAQQQPLADGIYGISNAALDSPWPKVTGGKQQFSALLARAPGSEALQYGLWQLLARRAQAPDHTLPDTGVSLEWERRLSARFIVSAEYGTRASSLLMLAPDGGGVFAERRFGADGTVSGETRLRLPAR